MQQILVAIDFSPVSTAVIEQAAALAKALSAELTIIHVAAPDPDFTGYVEGPQTGAASRAHELREEHRKLQEIAERLDNPALSVRALLIQGRTVEKILSEAARVRADLIVLGSHGHGALYRALLGSVSEGVLRAAQCSVLVVPAAHSKAE